MFDRKYRLPGLLLLTGMFPFLTGCLGPQRPLSEQDRNLVQKAEAYFNAQPVETGNFHQTGSLKEGSGTFLREPGRLCLYYAKPHIGSLFVDSNRIVKTDKKTGIKTSFKVKGTPFANFLEFPIHLSSNGTHIEDVRETEDGYVITLSKIYRTKKCTVTLIFSGKDMKMQLSGLKAVIADYYLQVLFQNIQKREKGQSPLCHPPV